MKASTFRFPNRWREYVDRQVASGEYSTTSEFIRQLIRNDQKQIADRRLQAALLDGLDSGEPIEVTDEWWNRKREEITARLNGHGERKASNRKRAKKR